MQQLTSVLGVAGIYALLATGIVLVYRTSRVVNLAQGHLAILCAFCVAAFVAVNQFTSIGLLMRATTENVVLAAQRGVNIDRIVCLAWVIAVCAAATGGFLHSQRAFVSTAAILIGVNALIAALIGGMDSFVGAMIGALTVAASEHFVL